MKLSSVLVIGASGRTGSYIVEALAKNSPSTKIFAFCRDPAKFDKTTEAYCEGVVAGDARSARDIEQAVDETQADLVVMAIGNGDNVAKSDIRTASAHALVEVMSQGRFQRLRSVVISSNGAGGSRVKIGLGFGTLLEYYLRHVFRDHTGQEAAFLSAGTNVVKRTMIVRPAALTEGESSPGGSMVIFGDFEKSPNLHIDRKDLAEWVVKEMRTEETITFGSKPVNITWKKPSKAKAGKK